jgi:hypothetical protein
MAGKRRIVKQVANPSRSGFFPAKFKSGINLVFDTDLASQFTWYFSQLNQGKWSWNHFIWILMSAGAFVILLK